MSSCYLFVCGLQERGREEVWVLWRKREGQLWPACGGQRKREGQPWPACHGQRKWEGQPWPACSGQRTALVAGSSLCSQCAKLAGPELLGILLSLSPRGAGSRVLALVSLSSHMSSWFTHLPSFCAFLSCFNISPLLSTFCCSCSSSLLSSFSSETMSPWGHIGFHFQWLSYSSLPRTCFIGVSHRHGCCLLFFFLKMISN